MGRFGVGVEVGLDGGNPSTTFGGPPPLSGEAFEGGDVLGMEWRFAWEGGNPSTACGGSPPLEGRLWEWEGLGVEVGVGLEGGDPSTA